MPTDKFFVDTNVIINAFAGIKNAVKIIDKNEIHISFVTEIEILSFPRITKIETDIYKKFFLQTYIHDYQPSLKNDVIYFRKKYNLKMADALIISSANHLGIPFITSDKIFTRIEEVPVLIIQD